MERWIRFSWILGVVIFVFGFIGSLVVGTFSQFVMAAHLIVGAALVLLWFFFVGVKNLSSARQIVSGRVARFGINALLYTAVFVGLLVVANYFAKKNELRWDLTEQGVYSLSDQSIKITKALSQPLKLVAIKDPQAVPDSPLNDLLRLYQEANSAKVQVEIVDPRSKPHLLDSYGMKPGNLVYLEFGEGEQRAVSRINEATEEAVTNAIIRLTRGAAKKVYYVEGHGQPDLKNVKEAGVKAFADALVDEHLNIEGLFLGTLSAIPEDAAAVVLVSPKKPLQESERKLLVDYARNGGRLLMFTDPRTTSDIKEIAAEFGIDVGENVIIDQVQRLFAAPALGAQPIVRDYTAHPVTRSMTPQHVTIYNIASSVKKGAKIPDGSDVQEIMKTSPTSWAETNLAALFDGPEPAVSLDPDDIQGPVSLAAAYEKKLESASDDGEQDFEKVSRVLVVGDSDWMLNANIGLYSNRDLVMNAVNWLVGEEGGISIRAKTIRASAAPIQAETFRLLFISGFIVPELILIFGLIVWWRRRTLFS